MARFKTNNRYTNGFIDINRTGTRFLVLRVPLKLEPAADDVFVTLTQDLIARPDLISYKAYGVSDLWWVIYEFNGIRDPLFGINLGQNLRIPAIDRVLTAIANLNIE